MSNTGFSNQYWNGKVKILLSNMMIYTNVMSINSNYHAPVTEMLEKGIAVLDTGCGPGTWDFEVVYSKMNISIL